MIDQNFGVNNEHPFWQGSLECKRGALIGKQKGREDRGKSEGRSSPLISSSQLYLLIYVKIDQLHLYLITTLLSQVYAADDWYNTQPGSIRLKIATKLINWRSLFSFAQGT